MENKGGAGPGENTTKEVGGGLVRKKGRSGVGDYVQFEESTGPKKKWEVLLNRGRRGALNSENINGKELLVVNEKGKKKMWRTCSRLTNGLKPSGWGTKVVE